MYWATSEKNNTIRDDGSKQISRHTSRQTSRDTDTKTDTKTRGHKDTAGTQRHRRDTKTQEGHKDTGETQRHRRERLPTDISGGLNGN